MAWAFSSVPPASRLEVIYDAVEIAYRLSISTGQTSGMIAPRAGTQGEVQRTLRGQVCPARTRTARRYRLDISSVDALCRIAVPNPFERLGQGLGYGRTINVCGVTGKDELVMITLRG